MSRSDAQQVELCVYGEAALSALLLSERPHSNNQPLRRLILAMCAALLHTLIRPCCLYTLRIHIQVLLQVAHSLQHLHEHDIIHSDVKCENCLLSSSNSSPIGFVVKLGESQMHLVDMHASMFVRGVAWRGVGHSMLALALHQRARIARLSGSIRL